METNKKLNYIPPTLDVTDILLETGFTTASVRVGEDTPVQEEAWDDTTDTGTYDDIMLM
ncbi:hypothetical protein [uncultured Bacteroides sp.]|jgi:hypothetical protein|uniref:hypothetical protein n=1 Tax=uncultured Bacteroides sp. TaxID=162156 RepID=UPI00267542AB|nr:hypothetical protein [uncultured Bacteroides sp.]